VSGFRGTCFRRTEFPFCVRMGGGAGSALRVNVLGPAGDEGHVRSTVSVVGFVAVPVTARVVPEPRIVGVRKGAVVAGKDDQRVIREDHDDVWFVSVVLGWGCGVCCRTLLGEAVQGLAKKRRRATSEAQNRENCDHPTAELGVEGGIHVFHVTKKGLF
jgi:hypothetical protein